MFRVARVLLLGGLIGKLLGAMREVISAWLFGTGHVAAAYRLSQSAFTIPIQGFVSDALNGGFTPRYSLHLKDSQDQAAALFSGMHAMLLVISSLVGILLFSFSRVWVGVLAPGFDAETAALAINMVRVLAFAVPVYVLAALYAIADVAAGRGQVQASRASAQSIGLITGTVLAWLLSQPLLIPGGFVATNAVLAIWGILEARKAKMPLWPKLSIKSLVGKELTAVWRAFRLLIWVPAILQVHFIVERRVASMISSDTVAAVDYARFISETAVILLAMPFGVAGLGTLAALSQDKFRDTALRAMRMLIFIGIPLSVILFVHATPLVKLILGRGAFSGKSVELTSAILGGVAIGLWGQLVGYAGGKFLNARGQNSAVLLFTVVGAGFNIAVNLICWQWLGAATLGYASAINGMLLGTLMMWKVGVLGKLLPDLISLGVASVGYVAIWAMVPHPLAQLPVVVAPLGIALWALAMTLWPPHRDAVRDLIRLVAREK